MSSSDAARRIRERFKLGTPPSPADTKGNLQMPVPGKLPAFSMSAALAPRGASAT